MCGVTSRLVSGVRPNGVWNRWNFCQLSVKPISHWPLLNFLRDPIKEQSGLQDLVQFQLCDLGVFGCP